MTIVLDDVLKEVVTQGVNKLVQTVADNVKLVRGIESEIKDMTSDIEMFNARLLDASENPRANELHVLKVVVKKFRTIVNEAQDVVAKYVALKKKHEDNAFAKGWDKIPLCGKVNDCASEIQSIRTKVNIIRQETEKDLISLINYQNNGQPASQAPVVEKVNVRGFKHDLKTIIDLLTEASDNLIFIPILGMAGSGKTTFATSIFQDPDIREKFGQHRIWVHVSQGFNKKQKFIDILHQITDPTENSSTISEIWLEKEINRILFDQKYFIVIDDVWKIEDWVSIKAVFPENSKGSRVLVTTRYGSVADAIGKPHRLRELSKTESWSLLKNNVFGEKGDSKPFETFGIEIAEKCKGLPLALVVIAGILRKCKMPADWKRIAENPFLEINRKDQSYHKLIMLSYDHLPEKLKDCFLYIASFPMGCEIAAWKLIRLWIAEEFIPKMDEWGNTLDLDVEARNYLNDLVDRNLAMVLKKRADGQIKTCRIHDSLHEFCKSEAAKKNLFRVMDEGQGFDENTISFRRLCFHSSTTNIFDAEDNLSSLFLSCYNKKSSSCPFGEHVHSFLSSSSKKRETHLTQKQLASIPNIFPLLRVLDIESSTFSLLPNELYGLYLLRYLAITTDINLLPKQFKNLRELETLVFKTSESTLQINGGIWNMEKLRHVHTNTSAQLPSPPKTSKNRSGSTEIRTLSTISPRSCTEKVFSKTPKLQKLGVRGNLAELLEKSQGFCLFNNLQKLDRLKNLKLRGRSEKLVSVPMPDKFPRRLRKLTLSNTLFKWNDLRILGLLEELEVLKLDENAFDGTLWNLKEDVIFKQLQYLRIGRTNLVTWTAAENSFPVLEHLIIRNCAILEEIPCAFAKVDSLKVMELVDVSEKAADSARKVEVQRHGRENVSGIHLSITTLPSQTPDHKQTHGEENNYASGFDLPSTSIPSQAMDHKQTHGEENNYASGFDLPSTSIPSQAMVQPLVEEDYVMGFEDHLKNIKARLTETSGNFIVIPIVGMPGIGKTTFAKKIFEDRDIRQQFVHCIWVYASHDFNRKKAFIDILDQIIKCTEDFSHISEDRLEDRIKDLLKNQKYFIVIDDVWERRDWDSLKTAFPENLKGSRVLVTTRSHSVAISVGEPYSLEVLSPEESWLLLKKNVFGEEGDSKPFEAYGRKIAEKCNGSLSLEVIAGILRNSRTTADWEQVAENPILEIYRIGQRHHELVTLSYDHLPEKLKNCFLYFASFPMGHEIVAWKLIRMWIAEEFIPTIDEWGYTLDLQVEAQEYLNDLVDRNLVMVLKRRADGQIKICRIHDSLYEFCKSEAARKNLFKVMDGGQRLDANIISAHRLCFHSSTTNIFDAENNPPRSFFCRFNKKRSPCPFGENVHSLLMSSSQKSEIHLTQEQLATIPNTFPLLRVLDIESLKFSLLPDKLYGLYLLKYLAITTDINVLPKQFKNLRELETLVIKTSKTTLQIVGGIWNMEKLRHVHINTSAQLPSPRKTSKNSSVRIDIRTLSTITPASCTEEIFSRTPNLQKLGVHGNLEELLEEKDGICLFNNIKWLDYLENLKLHGRSEKLLKVPTLDQFPRRLRKLTFSNTLFEWKDMSVLGSLEELEVLKLDENAFTGELWDLNDNVVFKQLQYLRIGRTNLVTWTATENSFPLLEHLIIRNCTNLQEIPSAFAMVERLKVIEVFRSSERAAISARMLHEFRRDGKDVKTNGFDLLIT